MEIINTDFENWGSYLMKQFQTMYEKSERCDLEISCNKQIFLVHRLIMSACSDYVRELGDKQHIILPEEVSCKTLKTVIDFVYSGKIIFLREDKEDLLIAASLLNMRLLIELIKREDPSSYTISMDDDNDENRETELINSAILENSRVGPSDNAEREQNSNFRQMATKRKSDTKPHKSKLPRKNCLVLPPLHKFPYLQQKFSGTRTYGLITNLTSPVPSRFEISDAELETSSYRSTFHDVTYDIQRLFPNPDSLKSLESVHIQFLKKLKDTPAHRRNYANPLYSPFDKYTSSCNLKVSESISSRRPESVVSYPPKADANSSIRKYHVNNALHAKEVNTRPSSPGTVSPSLLSSSSAPKEYKKSDTTKTALRNGSTNHPVGKRVRFSDSVDVREIDVPFAETITNDLETLPEPIMPSVIVQDTTSLSDGGHKVELIRLNNVVVPSDSTGDGKLNFLELEESADVSISVIQTNHCETNDILMETSSTLTTNETTEVEENQRLCETPAISETNASTMSASADEINIVPSNPCNIEFIDNVSADQSTENIGFEDNSQDRNNEDTGGAVGSSNPTVPLKSNTSVADIISTDTSLFTPLNAKTNSAQSPTELNSQIYALKVKGTESPAQLDRLVDLCKNNPLFKNKNIRFKIVPVKGPIREKLKETSLMNSGINKAIIVKRTENLTTAIATPFSNISSAITTISSSKSAETSKCSTATFVNSATNIKKNRTSPIENTSGPWDCTRCGAEPLVFNSYYDYRTHLHSVHKEPNNPVYCMHCGYKSLKRNMQLYHLFVKHNVSPPSHIKFPKCDKCEFYALNEYYLQKHLICHPSEGMEYVCSCKVAFKSSELLQRHMVSGDCKNSNSFACGYCRCVFDRFVNLKAHVRVCMKERSKPMLENTSSNLNAERAVRTISDGGKDYLAL